jgi:hypothetical protein
MGLERAGCAERLHSRTSLSCCSRSGKQDCEGPRFEKLLKTALERPKIIASMSSSLCQGRLISHFFLEFESMGAQCEALR